MENMDLIYVLPTEFQTIKDNYIWDEANSKFIYFDYKGKGKAERNFLSIIRNSYNLSKLLKKYIDIYKPDAVLLIGLVYFMPALPFLIRSTTSIFGIIYKIYLYRWSRLSIIQRAQNILVHFLYRNAKCLGGVFVLNDKSAALYLNKIYVTKKFIYLPDPYNAQSYIGKSIRGVLQIKENEKVYLHFGALASRKGTCEILDAILAAGKKDLSEKVFIFAGLVNEDIRDEFYAKISKLKDKSRIYVIDKFCSNNLVADLCASTDYILCPYKESDLSSGVLGYAAFYKKPVIAPQSGIIGKLIKKYALGLTINQIKPDQIWNAIQMVEKVDYYPKAYIDTVRIEEFNKIVMETIKRGKS